MTNQLKIAVLIYCENNCANWSGAMIEADYSENYALHKGWKLLEQEDVQAEIQAFIEHRREKADFNRDQSEAELNLARQRAIAKGDIPSEIAAIREKNTIFALRTENINTGDKTQPALTPAEQARYKLLAQHLSKPEPDEPGKAAG